MSNTWEFNFAQATKVSDDSIFRNDGFDSTVSKRRPRSRALFFPFLGESLHFC
ncbi:hypothetical protein MARPO_0012s0156 [Marchantia polymorpha]|uniref:Uncharacterized protein n=1 Tax=Marchantia polymorpha TaxID=3197 RepID=A0A2R6XJE0_MARPO|nr:hypothetical protein MARPO_0012s0156 [Marchantia polymorpha]|eukprot:PTQ46228.1 hypothetical protein MARPO_0012s0156 [Marchantia polymorpha]